MLSPPHPRIIEAGCGSGNGRTRGIKSGSRPQSRVAVAECESDPSAADDQAMQTFRSQSESDRREPVISCVTGGQLEDLPNMIQPPLLGVVNAASAVSARTLTCRAPAVPRSCSMLSVYMAVRRRPVPRLPPPHPITH